MRDSIPVRYNNAPPMVDDYCQLRLLAGMSPKAKETAEASLPNTVFGVSGYQCGELVAMGRIIGDSGCHLQLCDIAVHQDCSARHGQRGNAAAKPLDGAQSVANRRSQPTRQRL